MPTLTADQIEILRAAGRARVAARIAELLLLGKIAMSKFQTRGIDLLHIAEGTK